MECAAAPETAAATEPPASAPAPMVTEPPASAQAPASQLAAVAEPVASQAAPLVAQPVLQGAALSGAVGAPALPRSIYLTRSVLQAVLLGEREHGDAAPGLRGALIKLRTEANSEYVMCEIVELAGPRLERTVHLRGPYERLPDSYEPQSLPDGSGHVAYPLAGLAYLSDQQQLEATDCDQALKSMAHGWLTPLTRGQALELVSKLRQLKMRGPAETNNAARQAKLSAKLAARPPQQQTQRKPPMRRTTSFGPSSGVSTRLPSVPEDASSTAAQRPPNAEMVAAWAVDVAAAVAVAVATAAATAVATAAAATAAPVPAAAAAAEVAHVAHVAHEADEAESPALIFAALLRLVLRDVRAIVPRAAVLVVICAILYMAISGS